ncbi:hypothetical protein [Nocardia tengchongensis]|uniref:hypothetical protein n=1 Tax=Nocardia tengchongensis TaxID=2055889 RepID=UPI0036776AFA
MSAYMMSAARSAVRPGLSAPLAASCGVMWRGAVVPSIAYGTGLVLEPELVMAMAE